MKKINAEKKTAKTRSFFLCAALPVFFFFASCEQPAGRILNRDASLKSLSVSTGTLRPAFAADSFQYTLTVRNTVESITITALSNSAGARVMNAGLIRLDGKDEQSVSVGVNAENGEQKIYKIIVRRIDPSPKSIESAEDMAKIGVDEDFPLEADYNLAGDITLENWTGIAGGPGEAYSGIFDGDGHTITLKGLNAGRNTVSRNGTNLLAGIFCRIADSAGIGAGVKDLAVFADTVDMDIAAGDHLSAGVIAGYAEAANFENITIEGKVSVKNSGVNKRLYLGGIAGIAAVSAIKNCQNTAEIYGFGKAGGGTYNQIGGLVGMFCDGTTISDCTSTGSVKGETSGAMTNVFAGGIAGGSYFNRDTGYRGKIENCSSSGDVHAGGGGFWSCAGGIAGTVVGDGNGGPDGPTRISGSFSSGTISAAGPAWVYLGGITAYNYYGALISQCYFSGTVSALCGTYDYSGGIAGYNSQSAGHNSRIEDCWSSGTVTGLTNAGGIAGQNEVHASLLRCYSTAGVSVSESASVGAGGIVGKNSSEIPDALASCVALNPSLKAPAGNNIHRVAGGGGGVKSGNYAWRDMEVSTTSGTYSPGIGEDEADGADCDKKPGKDFYISLDWDFTKVWKMESGDDYPKLKWQE